MECKEVWSDRAYATAAAISPFRIEGDPFFIRKIKKKNYVGVNNIRSAFSIYLYFISFFFPPQVAKTKIAQQYLQDFWYDQPQQQRKICVREEREERSIYFYIKKKINRVRVGWEWQIVNFSQTSQR